MANTFFLVGHGVGYTNQAQIQIPAEVTVNFAVAAGWRSTGQLSTACMRGEFTNFAETIAGPGSVPQHFLCPDTPQTHMSKLKAFHTGVSGLSDKGHYWLVCVRGPYEIALSSIITRLMSFGLSKPFNLIWTCCRSPINERSPGTVYFSGGKPDERKGEATETTKSPTHPGNAIVSNSCEGMLTIISGSDIQKAPTSPFDMATVGEGVYGAAELFGIAHDFKSDDDFRQPVKATGGAKGLAI